MRKYLKDYITVFEKELNTSLMKKEDDRPLVEYVKDSWRSLQIIDGIEILGFEYTDKESEIDINKYIFKRNVKSKEKYNYKYINDTRVGLLTVHIKLTIESTDPKTGDKIIHEQKITKSMLIPLQDDDGCYYLNGQKVYLIYQLVEKSTYTAANAVILKSLMPFAIMRHTTEEKDTNGNKYILPYYTIKLFKRDIEVMLLYASTYGGLNGALQFAIDYPYMVMKFVEEEDPNDLVHLYFEISSKLFIKVNKELFDRFVYVRSVVGGILKISTNRLTLSKIDNEDVWLKKLGGNPQKGESLLQSAKRLLDATTGQILKLNIYNKCDVASLTRWMCEEYNDLRMKDNMDLKNKRLRSNEIISSLLTQDFSNRLNRLMSFGKKASIDNYRELFSFPGDILIQKLHSSGILRYNDIINDQDFYSKYKFTIKGPHSFVILNEFKFIA